MNKAPVLRLPQLQGLEGRKNDVVFCGIDAQQHVIFFPGDVQNFVEEMAGHRDNKSWQMWDLETVALILEKRFPDSFIWVIRPSYYHLHTFSCFGNFVESNVFGVPDYRHNDYGALKHTRALLDSGIRILLGLDKDDEDPTCDFPIILAGFSKGCVVLNQIVHELDGRSASSDLPTRDFISRIQAMHWLDGGHSGESQAWITDDKLLYLIAKTIPNIFVHVTPYQIKDKSRPWIGKEYKKFVEILRANGANIKCKLHFEEKTPSLSDHFRLLKYF